MQNLSGLMAWQVSFDAASMAWSKTLFRFVCLFVLLSQCQPTKAQTLVDVAPDFGIEHTLAPSNFWGSGVSFFDFDNDGWDDITFLQENDSLLFFKNELGVPAPLASIAYGDQFTKQALWVDYDNDGDFDLFVSCYEGKVKLYQNQGDFTFLDVSSQAGLLDLNTRNYGISAADYDRDGYLDLYICRYFGSGEPDNPAVANALYRNNGDGTFTNVAAQAGVSNGVAPSFMGVWLDFNADGWPDLYVINDRSLWGNALYQNNGDGTFSDVTHQTNTGYFGDDPMTATVGDFDNDGDLDIYMTNTGPNGKVARLARANSDDIFDEYAAQAGVNLNITAWGASFIDVDNDTYQDLFVATAQLASNLSDVRSYLYLSVNGQFLFDSPTSIASPTVSAAYGVAKGDLNNDGFADLVVQTAKEHNVHILQNSGISENSYAKITLEGTASNTMAIGSWIHLYANETFYVHYTKCGENYCGQNSQHHIFGLGQATQIDSLTVWFPSGHTDTYYNLEVNQHHTLIEGGSISTSIAAAANHLCPGEEITLQAFGGVYQIWNDGLTTTDGLRTVSSPGAYSFTAFNEFNVPAFSDTLFITATDQFALEINITQPGCEDQSGGALEISLTNPDLIQNGQLWVNGLAAGWTMTDLQPGSYTIEFTSALGCQTAETIQLFPIIPIESIVTAGNIDCHGSTTDVFITVFGATNAVIDWGVVNPDEIQAGEYSAIVMHSDDCFSIIDFTIDEPDPILITLDEISETPLPQVTGGTPPYTIDWFEPGGTNALELPIVLDQTGTYLIQATDHNLCQETISFEYIGTSVASFTDDREALKLYPNPSTTLLHLEGKSLQGATALITDLQGKRLFEKQLSAEYLQTFNIAHLAQGVYVLHVIHPAGAKQAEHLKFFKAQ